MSCLVQVRRCCGLGGNAIGAGGRSFGMVLAEFGQFAFGLVDQVAGALGLGRGDDADPPDHRANAA
jgi:hypothetical protein